MKDYDIQLALENVKTMYESAILSRGVEGRTSLIRSQKLIMNIHDAVKASFIKDGVEPNLIFPRLGRSSPELKLKGMYGSKDHDVCVLPRNAKPWLDGMDKYGKDYTEQIIVVGVRSQMSSLMKNKKTMFQNNQAEVLSMHLRCPMMVMGEVFMIPTRPYCSEAMKEREIKYLDRPKNVQKYINDFQSFNDRLSVSDQSQAERYERACLLIVDFSQSPVKLYTSHDELFADGLVDDNASYKYDGLEWDGFTEDLLDIWDCRFNEIDGYALQEMTYPMTSGTGLYQNHPLYSPEALGIIKKFKKHCNLVGWPNKKFKKQVKKILKK